MATSIPPDPPSGGSASPPDSTLSMTALSIVLPTLVTPSPKPKATLEGMPSEIMSMILDTTHEPKPGYYWTPSTVHTVDSSQIFALRLSSRRLASTTFDTFVRRFFKTRKHVLSQSSMQRLADIIADPRFGPYIKEMAFVPECDRCSGYKHTCGDCDRLRRRKWVHNWSTRDLLQQVDMDPELWLDTCSRVQVLKFNKTWPGPYTQLVQFEIHWIKNILANCLNIVDLTLLNEIAACSILNYFKGNSLRRFTLGSGCRVVYSTLGALLKQHTDTLEEIKIAGVKMQCGNCDEEDTDGSAGQFLSWFSMFEFMLEMSNLKSAQFDTLMQSYHGHHEQHMRVNNRNVHPSAIAENRCFVACEGDVVSKLQLAIDRSYTVRIPDGSRTIIGDRTVQVLFPQKV